jgi:hypothetical protein
MPTPAPDPRSDATIDRRTFLGGTAGAAATLAVLPIVVSFHTVATYRHSMHPTVSDGLLVGFATGAGLGFHEEMTYSRLVPIGPGAEYGSAGRMGQEIWWSYVFPLIGWQGQFNIRQFGNGVTGNFTLYHAGWGTLLGIGIGLIYVHRHRVLAWAAGLVMVGVTYLEHMSGNWGVANPLEPAPLVGDLFQAGDVTGVTELAVYLLLVAIAGAIIADIVILRRIDSQLGGFFPSVHSRQFLGTDTRDGVGDTTGPRLRIVSQLRSLDVYARSRRALLIGIYNVQQTNRDPDPLGPIAMSLYNNGRRAKIYAGIGLFLTVVFAILGVLMSSGVSVGAHSVGFRMATCAGCAPPSRFMGTVPSVLGAVFGLASVGFGIRAWVSDSRWDGDASSDDADIKLDDSRAPGGTVSPSPQSPPPPQPPGAWSKRHPCTADQGRSSTPGSLRQMTASYDPATGKIVLKGVDKNGGALNVTDADG